MNKNMKKEMNKPNNKTINNKSNKTFKSEITKSNFKPINMHKDADKYYKCYSVKLRDFLKDNNLEVIKEIRHPKTNKIAFVFEKNMELDKLLTIWTKNKDKNSN